MRTILVTGISNRYSIAYSVASKLVSEGYRLIVTYPRGHKERLERLNINGVDMLLELEASSEESIQECIAEIKNKYTKIDGFLHSIAFSDSTQLCKDFFAITKENFMNAVDISAYSLFAITKEIVKQNLMPDGGSILTMTYIGSNRVIPHYNVMGPIKAALESFVRYLSNAIGRFNIRVNALSSGPVDTLSARGIKDFRHIFNVNRKSSPLKRNINHDDISKSALYLLSDMSSGITGEIHYVDGGFNVIGIEDPYEN